MAGQVRITLPEIIRMSVPRDYAKACGGSPLRIESATEFVENAIIIEWTEHELRLRSADAVVIYERNSVIRFEVNRAERILGCDICTLRIVFRGYRGTIGSLCVVGPNRVYLDEFNGVIERLHSAQIPFVFIESMAGTEPSPDGSTNEIEPL